MTWHDIDVEYYPYHMEPVYNKQLAKAQASISIKQQYIENYTGYWPADNKYKCSRKWKHQKWQFLSNWQENASIGRCPPSDCNAPPPPTTDIEQATASVQ